MQNEVDGDAARKGISPYLVALLALAMFLNYTDRGSLSIVAPALKQQLGISNAAMGLTLSAFFWSYAIAQPAAGWVAQPVWRSSRTLTRCNADVTLCNPRVT